MKCILPESPCARASCFIVFMMFVFYVYFFSRFLHILIEANEHFWSKLLKNLPFGGKNWPKIPKKSQNWPSKNVRYIYSCLMSKNPDLANFLLHKKSVSTKKFVKSVFYVIFTVVKSVDYCITISYIILLSN